MARQPIVLTSNLIPNLEPNTGALANIYSNKDPVNRDPIVENEDGTFTIPTYERTVVDDIPDDFDWSMYGRAGPTLRYFHRVRTGEIEYDPSNDVVDPSTLTDTSNPDLPDAAEVLKQELIGVGTQLAAGAGAQVGRAFAKTDDLGQAFGAYFNPSETMDLIRSPDTGLTAKVPFSPDSVNAKIAKFDETINLKPTTQTDLALRNEAIAGKEELLATATPADTDIFSGMRDRFDTSSAAGRATLYGSAGAGLGAVAANLIAGRNLKDSVKTGAKVGAGTYVGTLIGGPIGGLIGGVFGGRVICNELMRQDVMTRKQVVLDYKFTRDHLTPTHVNGYHVWAVWMVRQMRKGRFVPFWKHVAGHRANEIAYIYGERDKPDYLGKVYRKVLEPICWSIGFFCKKTDWTVLYKQKEV
ncbi:hypothetical protein OAU55_00120 [Candidatus Pelagibacter sp.]|nr:hypothetical protein [Candidatus Pelagibacter sp.]